MPNTRFEPIDILLVEDSPTDALLAKAALENSKINNTLHTTTDGVEAIAFLNKEGRHVHAPRPNLILLDLNLPKKDGREVLAEIKSDEKLKRIPVVVLTTSQDEKDVSDAYGLHANCYISKPVDFEQFTRIVSEIEGFWFSIVTLPSEA